MQASAACKRNCRKAHLFTCIAQYASSRRQAAQQRPPVSCGSLSLQSCDQQGKKNVVHLAAAGPVVLSAAVSSCSCMFIAFCFESMHTRLSYATESAVAVLATHVAGRNVCIASKRCGMFEFAYLLLVGIATHVADWNGFRRR